MTRLLAIGLASTMLATPAFAQSMGSMPGMQGMSMPGMKMPAKLAPKVKAKAPAKARPTKRTSALRARAATTSTSRAAMPGMNMGQSAQGAPAQGQPMQGHAMSSMPGMDMSPPKEGQDASSMAGMNMGGMPGMPGMTDPTMSGTKPVAGDTPAPPAPTDHAADIVFSPERMQQARRELHTEHGGMNFHQVMLNLAEYQFRNGRDGYRWDGQAWYGGDINRLFVKYEGEGTFRGGVESAEAQALYSRAVGPYFNLQGGVRQDLGPSPKRTYATVQIEGLAPNSFDVEGALFLSNKGDLLGRLEGYYDQRITQRLILQPRAELNFAARDVPENRIGSGLSNAELGLRLRYEIKREFAPYVGVSWDRRVGDTARFVRAAGDDPSSRSMVAGIRLWF